MHPKRSRLVQVSVLLLFAGILGIRALSEPKSDFRFSIVGDRTGSASPQVYGRVWREVDLLRPDFVINVGDVIQGGNDQRAEADWQEVSPIWKRYGPYPLYFTPGNHDIWSPWSEKLFEKYTQQKPYYGFNYQDAHFTVLDNSRSLDLSEEQIRFLERDLEANRERKPKFIFFHKPYWIVFLKAQSGEFSLHQVAKKYGVEHVISGHGHQFVRMERDGISYMEVGSSGATIGTAMKRFEGFSQGRFYHHVWATVKGAKAYFTVKEIDGPMGEGRMFRAEDWDEKGPKFDTGDPAISAKPET